MSFPLGIVLTMNVRKQQTSKTSAFIKVLTFADDGSMIPLDLVHLNVCGSQLGPSHSSSVFWPSFCWCNVVRVLLGPVFFLFVCLFLMMFRQS